MDREREQFVDQLLNASLERYRGEGPRPGMEARILASVAAATRRERRGWAWGLVISSAALVLVVAIHAAWHRTSPVTPAPLSTASRAQNTAAVVPPKVVEPQFQSARVRREIARQARPQEFPTPVPLSEQEKLLLRYVHETSKSESAGQKRPALSEDLQIPPLHVAALEIKLLPGSQE